MEANTTPAAAISQSTEIGSSAQVAACDAPLYRFHNFRVLDAAGRQVGVADWIWADPSSGQSTFIGIRLNWLLGTAQAIPTRGLRIDSQARTLQVAYGIEQIKRMRRYAIRRTLPAAWERTVWRRIAQRLPLPGLVDRDVLAA